MSNNFSNPTLTVHSTSPSRFGALCQWFQCLHYHSIEQSSRRHPEGRLLHPMRLIIRHANRLASHPFQARPCYFPRARDQPRRCFSAILVALHAPNHDFEDFDSLPCSTLFGSDSTRPGVDGASCGLIDGQRDFLVCLETYIHKQGTRLALEDGNKR